MFVSRKIAIFRLVFSKNYALRSRLYRIFRIIPPRYLVWPLPTTRAIFLDVVITFDVKIQALKMSNTLMTFVACGAMSPIEAVHYSRTLVQSRLMYPCRNNMGALLPRAEGPLRVRDGRHQAYHRRPVTPL
jgi:hypothetical protein